MVNSLSNLVNEVPFWYGIGKSVVMGGVSGAISFGIGSVALSAGSNAIIVQSALHGVSAGIMSEIEGGTFISGFASGAVSSLVGSAFSSTGNTTLSNGSKFSSSTSYKAMMIAAGGVAGGISSTIAGGNFWSGMRQGIITTGLNHAMHQIVEPLTNREQKAEKLVKRYRRNINRIMAESLVAESLLEITESGDLLTGFSENFDKVYGNEQSYDAHEVYSSGIEIVKNIKDSFGGGKIKDSMLFKVSAAIYADILYLHMENNTLSTSIKDLDRNVYYKYVAPSERPQRGRFSGGGSGGRW